MKADLFDMLAHPSEPWSTLGWTHFDGVRWVRHPAATSWSGFVQALLGSTITGFSLGFGSTFWHDTLGIVLELRKLTEQRASRTSVEQVSVQQVEVARVETVGKAAIDA